MYGQNQNYLNPGAGYLPSTGQLKGNFAVNFPGIQTAIAQSLYDSAVYPAAGIASLTFFSTPIGQGVGFGGGAKTLSDTNMVTANQLPALQQFWMTSIEVEFQPTTPTVTAGMPAVFGAQLVDTLVNDVYIFRRSGNLNFVIGAKSFLQEAPLMRLPATRRFNLSAALADVSTTGAALQSRIAWADVVGQPYNFSGGSMQLISNQNFSVTLAWPEGAQAITNPARVFVRLNGYLYRPAQ